MFFISPNSRHTTVFRPRTNLPFERGVKYSSDDFVSELKKSFVRPTDDDMARSKPPLARQKSAITLEGPRGDFRTNKYADYVQGSVKECILGSVNLPRRPEGIRRQDSRNLGSTLSPDSVDYYI